MKGKPTFAKWARAIKDRDGWECVYCGSKDRLEAHHIQFRSEKPELDFEMENGVTLCHKCHLVAHGGYYSGQCWRDEIDPMIMDTFIFDYIERKHHGAPDWGID